jgi:hypothetical protein
LPDRCPLPRAWKRETDQSAGVFSGDYVQLQPASEILFDAKWNMDGHDIWPSLSRLGIESCLHDAEERLSHIGLRAEERCYHPDVGIRSHRRLPLPAWKIPSCETFMNPRILCLAVEAAVHKDPQRGHRVSRPLTKCDRLLSEHWLLPSPLRIRDASTEGA